MNISYFGAIIDGKRYRLPKRTRNIDPLKPNLNDIAKSFDPIMKASYVIDLDTKIILKDRTGELTNFDNDPIYAEIKEKP